MTKRAVVLAAGRGNRLERRTDACAKSLVPLAGKPLIHHVLASLAGAGISEAIIVIGYHGDQIRASLGDGHELGLTLRYVWNTDYRRGNASSLWCALPFVAGEPFLLVMGDHISSPTLLRSFLAGTDGHSALAIDRSELSDEVVAEATKVELLDGRVVDIGKGLSRWHALDTGFSYWVPGAFSGAREPPPSGELAAQMADEARQGRLVALDVSGHFWLDIDTEDDLRAAEELLKPKEQQPV